MNHKPNNKKVAKARGQNWKKSLVAGKLEAQTNPTKLRILRAKTTISQQEAAKRLNLSASTYLAIERGHRFVDANRAAMIAKYFKVFPTTIFKSNKAGKFSALA